MKVSARFIPIIVFAFGIATLGAVTMQDTAGQTAAMTKAAQAFVETLTAEQKNRRDVPVQRRRSP